MGVEAGPMAFFTCILEFLLVFLVFHHFYGELVGFLLNGKQDIFEFPFFPARAKLSKNCPAENESTLILCLEK